MTARTLLLLGGFLALLPSDAFGQTRFSINGGVLVPFGSLEDTTEPSIRGALRAEIQPVNSLGKRKLLSFFFYAAYSDLSLKSEVENALVRAGEETSSYIFDTGGGIRVYSKVAPFFIEGGVGYVRFRPPGDVGATDGFDIHGGLGFAVPLGALVGEVETTLHEVLIENDDDFQFLAATAGIALPF